MRRLLTLGGQDMSLRNYTSHELYNKKDPTPVLNFGYKKLVTDEHGCHRIEIYTRFGDIHASATMPPWKAKEDAMIYFDEMVASQGYYPMMWVS